MTSVHYWTGPKGMIVPEVQNVRDRRTPRLFSARNLVQIATLHVLSRRRISAIAMQAVLRPQPVADSGAGVDPWEIPARREELLFFIEGLAWQYVYSEALPQIPDTPDLFTRLMGQVAQVAWPYTEVVIVNLANVKRNIAAALP